MSAVVLIAPATIPSPMPCLIIIAAKNSDSGAVTEELCDLAYHALVLMFTQGLDPRDIAGTLAKRHKKEGNLKKQNDKGAY